MKFTFKRKPGGFKLRLTQAVSALAWTSHLLGFAPRLTEERASRCNPARSSIPV